MYLTVVFHMHSDTHHTYPDPHPVQVLLEWDQYDPWAISATFHTDRADAGVPWVLSRDLLTSGMFTPTGWGDVRVYPPVDGWLGIGLTSPSGRAEFTVAVGLIEAFLAEIERRCPEGSEYAWLDVDAALVDLLESEAAA